jgi:hypothetical protein
MTSRSPKGLPRLKEVQATVLARRGKGSVRLMDWWRFMVPAVLGVNLMDRWRCASSDVLPAPQRGRRPPRCGARRLLLLLLPPPPLDGSMMKGHGPMQSIWDNPNCGRHMTHLDDPLDGHRGLRAPSAGSPVGRGKGMGAALILDGVARSKATVVEMQGRQRCGSGIRHHDDRGGDGVGR